MALRLRRGTDAQRQFIVPAEGELIYTTDTKQLFVGDGSTTGGIPATPVENLLLSELADVGSLSPTDGQVLTWNSITNKWESQTLPTDVVGLSNIVEDTTPELGGSLNLNGYSIVGTGNINIDGTINATGSINLGDGIEDSIIVGGSIGSSLIPNTNLSFDLGDATKRWRHGYFEDFTVNDTLTVNNAVNVSGTLTATTISSDLIGSISGTDSTLLVDSTTNIISNGILTLLEGNITSTQPFNAFYDNIATGSNILQLGTKDEPSTVVIHAESDAFLITRGITDGAGGGPSLRLDTSRGTYDAPAVLEDGDNVGKIIFSGLNQYGEYAASCGVMTDVIDGANVKSSIGFAAVSDSATYPGGDGLHYARLMPSGEFTAMAFQPNAFADPAARDAAIPTPVPGMIIFLSDSTGGGGPAVHQGYNGTSWNDLY